MFTTETFHWNFMPTSKFSFVIFPLARASNSNIAIRLFQSNWKKSIKFWFHVGKNVVLVNNYLCRFSTAHEKYPKITTVKRNFIITTKDICTILRNSCHSSKWLSDKHANLSYYSLIPLENEVSIALNIPLNTVRWIYLQQIYGWDVKWCIPMLFYIELHHFTSHP